MVEAPQPWPAVLRKIPAGTPQVNIAVCERAHCDLGSVFESPPGSNRGDQIDTYNFRAGAPLGSYWCCSAATAWYVDGGARVPDVPRGACQTVMDWAQHNGLWTQAPTYGSLILYGTPDGHGGWLRNDAGHYAHHIGLVILIAPYILSIEGNAAWDGFSSNGEAVCLKRSSIARAMGYVTPTPHT